ncbi:UbiA family prenyltransferase [Streptomyces sp. NPDC000134]|uniref:UbiA family prenyltransferase n=1 Tax=Streptomyces sp. NPDC000134 TaxID=3364536 RepID=UPI0036CDC1C9
MSLRDRPGAYARLVRMPAGLTVPGDILAGAAAGGAAISPRLLGPVASSLCLYWGGMALNDYVDRSVDAEERPERPVPAGEISPAAALGTAVVLTASGLGLAVLGEGRRGLATALPLTAAVWAYDTVAKDHAAGPLVMGAARGLDVLRGAGAGRPAAALPAALALALHTASVTALSRHETVPAPTPSAGVGGPRSRGAWSGCDAGPGDGATGSAPAADASGATGPSGAPAGSGGPETEEPWEECLAAGAGSTGRGREPGRRAADSPTGISGRPSGGPRAAAVGSMAAAGVVGCTVVLAADGAGRRDRAVASALAAGFLTAAGRGQLAALRKPTPYHVRRAVAAAIHAMVPLQSALMAAAGRSGAGLALLAAYPLTRRLSRKVSPT